jgi:hypothetical protein
MNNTLVARISAGMVLLLAGLGCIGCDDVSWPEAQYVDSLRVLGVTANPPTLAPGASTELSLFCADGRGGPTSDPSCNVEVAWFGGCDNPPENDPKKCFEHYRGWGEVLAASVADTPAEAWPAGFEFGPKMQLTAPNDVLANELEAMGQAVRYGTSYAFFAACAGRLIADPNAVERLPVACADATSGRRLGQDRFVVGYTTLYSYDGIVSRNPVIVNPRILDRQFNGASLDIDCASTGACPNGFACSQAGQCLPVVPPCNKADPHSCEPHCIALSVTPESFLLYRADGVSLTAPTKSLWINYFTNSGGVPDDNGYAIRPTSADDPSALRCAMWRAPTMTTDNAHVWLVIRDDRGGVATWDQRILVR